MAHNGTHAHIDTRTHTQRGRGAERYARLDVRDATAMRKCAAAATRAYAYDAFDLWVASSAAAEEEARGERKQEEEDQVHERKRPGSGGREEEVELRSPLGPFRVPASLNGGVPQDDLRLARPSTGVFPSPGIVCVCIYIYAKAKGLYGEASRLCSIWHVCVFSFIMIYAKNAHISRTCTQAQRVATPP